MVFVYFIVGLLNVFSQHHNYGIKIEDPNFDVRVRRSIEDAVKPEVFNIPHNLEPVIKTDVLESDVIKSGVLKTDVLKRQKRRAYYKKTRITYNDLLKYSSNNNSNNSESQTNKRRYDIFNPNYNFLFNTTRNNQNNNTGVKNSITINSRPLTRSYPYRYAPGYEPRPNRATGYNVLTTTPVFYNYQNPNKPNFAGYGGYTAEKPGYENVTPGYKSVTSGYNGVTPGYNGVTPGYKSVTPRYYNAPLQDKPSNAPIAKDYPWNSALPPTSNSQNPYNNFPTTNNSGIHNLPYNNNYNNDNLPQYARNFNNGTTASNNIYVVYIPASNTSLTPGNDYNFPSINDYNLPSNNNTVSPTNNNNGFSTNNNNTISPTNNNVFPTNNTNVTPSNINTTITTTPKILFGCVICNIPCPQFMRRFGMYCMPENDDDY